MVAAHGLLRIFWPSDAPRSKGVGTIVGWKNSNLDVFVVSIVAGVEVSGVGHLVRLDADEISQSTSKMQYRLGYY